MAPGRLRTLVLGDDRPRDWSEEEILGYRRALQAAIAGFPGEFTLGDLERACPGASRELARRVLRDLRRAGEVECHGRGPGARWRCRRSPGS